MDLDGAVVAWRSGGEPACDTNRTAAVVAASVMLASPANLARLLELSRDAPWLRKIERVTGFPLRVPPVVTTLQHSWCPTCGTPGRDVIER